MKEPATRDEHDASGAPVDLRLVVPALAAWVGAAVGAGAEPRHVALIVGTTLAAALLAYVVLAKVGLAQVGSAKVRLAKPPWAGCRVWARVTATATALLCAGLLCGSFSHETDTGGPLRALAEARAAVTVTAVVTGDPRLVAPRAVRSDRRPEPERVSLPVRVERVEWAGQVLRVHSAIVVLAASKSWGRLLPSTRLQSEGTLLPDERGSAAGLLEARGPPHVTSGPSRLHRAAGEVREGLRRAATVLPPGPRALLPGLVVGDVSGIGPEMREEFRATGLSHLTAVSGFNLTLVIGAVLALCRWGGLRRGLAVALAGLALGSFVVLARPSASVLRAAAMSVVLLVGLASGRRRAAVPALATAVVVLVLVRPELARSYGFALSVVATGALVLVAPGWRGSLHRAGWPRWLAEALSVPAAAALATAPVVAMMAGTVSLAAVAANALAAPAVAPATLLGLVAALLSPLHLGLAQVPAATAGLAAAWIVAVAHTGAGLPGAALAVPSGGRGLLLVGLVAALVGLGVRRRRGRRLLVTAAAAAVLARAALAVPTPDWPPPGWLLVMCDVGQGDALVLHAAPGTAVVVDAGPDPDLLHRCLDRLHVREVPLVVVTHLHADHMDGLAGLTRSGRRVGQVLTSPLAGAGRLRLRGAGNVQVGLVGQVWRFPALALTVLAPASTFPGSPNNSSVVLKAEWVRMTALLTGDVEPPAQRELLHAGVDLRADVIKVPHHGSAAQERAFLDAVQARVALVSVGTDNDYGHPAPGTLDMLRVRGTRVLRSDRDGSVAVVPGPDGFRAVSTRRRDPSRGQGRRPRRRGAPLQARATMPAVARVTVVVGDEPFLVQRAVRAAVDAARAGAPDLVVNEVAGSELRAEDLGELVAPSLFSDERALVVLGAHEAGKDAAAALGALAVEGDDGVVLVVSHAGANRGRTLLERLLDCGALRVDCPKLTRPSDRADFARAEATAYGCRMSEGAVMALLDAVGSDLREIATAVRQLASDSDGVVDVDVVHRYHSGRPDASSFAVADRAVEGDAAAALEQLRWALGEGVAPVLVVSAVGQGLRNIAQVAAAGQGRSQDLARRLGMPPWKVDRVRRQVRGWRPAGIAAALTAVAHADGAVKGAAVDPDYALERLVLDVVAAHQAAG